MTEDDKKICFVIAPIGEPDSDIRRRSDQILQYIIRPAVNTLGYRAIRADEIDEPGIITSQVIQHVVDDPLVVADLTGHNPNVFYELAIRHAIRKPYVQIIQKGESIPFDVAATRTIFVDHRDLDVVDTAKSQIIEQVRSLESDSSSLESPISMSVDLQRLRQSEDPEQRSLADVLAEISVIRNILMEFSERELGGRTSQFSRAEIGYLENRLMDAIRQTLEQGRTPYGRRDVDPNVVIKLSRSTTRGPGDLIAFPVILGYLRDEVPGIYEVGMEVYRQDSAGNSTQAREMAETLMRLIRMGPTIHPSRPETHELINELLKLTDYYLTATE